MSARLGLAGALLLAAPALGAAERIPGARTTTRAAADPAPIVATLGRAGAEWVAWTVPGLPEAAGLCCSSGDWRVRRCTLAGREGGWGTSADSPAAEAPTELLVFAEIDHGRARSVRSAGPACPIDGAGRAVVWIDGVDPEASVAWLDGVVRSAGGRRMDDAGSGALAALAHHLSPAADRRLAGLAFDPGAGRERREEALFWSGAVRGPAGYELLDRALADGDDADLREQALFGLSQSPVPEARPRLLRAAREDGSAEVRGQALFWLSQDAPDPGIAADQILVAIAEDPDEEVREQGVFALSQLETGVDSLVRLLRESRDPEIRQQALFWLAQSEDPRALGELERILAAR